MNATLTMAPDRNDPPGPRSPGSSVPLLAQWLCCRWARRGAAFCALTLLGFAGLATAQQPLPADGVIWRDSFDNFATTRNSYLEYDNDGGEFTLVPSDSPDGGSCFRTIWQRGEQSAGHLILCFGRNPLNNTLFPDRDFREIYWRVYMKLGAGFTGQPDKLTRATIFTGTNWAQAMIAHVWTSSAHRDKLLQDPATGIDAANRLVTTTYNDFAHLGWLGSTEGKTSIRPGQWYRVEAHVKLNTPGMADGILEFWIDGNLEARRDDLNWVGTWQVYGINAVFLENFWNNGSPAVQESFFDGLVVSTQPIGTAPVGTPDTTPPAAPTNLRRKS